MSPAAAIRQDARAGQRQVRLSAADKAELVERFRGGVFKKELARQYGIHVETVRAIVTRSALGRT